MTFGDRYGKSFRGYRDIKAVFYDLESNRRYLDLLDRTDELYRQQPRRSGCKLCGAAFGRLLFRRAGIDHYLCEACGHFNGSQQDTAEFNAALYADDSQEVGTENVYNDATREAYANRVAMIYRPKIDYLTEVLTALGEAPETLRYADFGSGGGHLVAAMRDAGLDRSIGHEVSESEVAYANAMGGGELLRWHPLEAGTELAASIEADVVTSVFQLEHVQDPVELCQAWARNPTARYLLLAVPVFSVASILQVAFPEAMPRVLGLGHTHLFTQSSLDWLCRTCGFEVLSRWWFGSDAFDLHRSVAVKLLQNPDTAPLVETWDDMILPALDKLQLALDEQKGASEVHMIVRLPR